jgi:exodeoxyribonuclease VII small subunit
MQEVGPESLNCIKEGNLAMPDQRETEPSFEEALSQLERIVEDLERGEPELTSGLAKYEKGVKLLTQCYRLLDQAEHSVALLTGVDNQGNPLTAPFDASATLAREATPTATAAIVVATTAVASPDDSQRKTSSRTSYRKVRASPQDDVDPAADPPF